MTERKVETQETKEGKKEDKENISSKDKKKLELKTIEAITKSKRWFYFGRNFSSPKFNIIALKPVIDEGEFANAARVFEVMQLDLNKLSQIFIEEPWKYYTKERIDRKPQPIVKNYQSLGICRVCDYEGWRELAKLTGKTIHFIHRHGGERGQKRAIYYPDGSFKIVNPYT